MENAYSFFLTAMGTEALKGLAAVRGEDPPESFESQIEDVLMGGEHDDNDGDYEDVPDENDAANITYAIRDIVQDR